MKTLQRHRHTLDTFLFISHTTNILLFKSCCNIVIGFRIIKEMPGLVGSGTPCILYVYLYFINLPPFSLLTFIFISDIYIYYTHAFNSWQTFIFHIYLYGFIHSCSIFNMKDVADHFWYICFLGLLASVTDGSWPCVISLIHSCMFRNGWW